MDVFDVRLYTDGACSGNPGPGGWAYILEHVATGRRKKEAGCEPQTTNNRMELMAVIRGLEALQRPCRVNLVTDSQYVAKGLSEWMPKWKANGWRRGRGSKSGEVRNIELWQELDELAARHRVRCTHVLGHAGHPENDECDRMAVEAYQKCLRR
jgi:ribonuclease HI